jgi:acyl-CoA thioester hydrolase
MPYRHEIRVRYAEVDMQRHVFNANYLVYVDDASDTWFREAIGADYGKAFDVVLKRMDITWHGAAGWGDMLAVDVEVRRWGTTSFDIGFEGSVDDSPVFSATVTYVSVDEGSTRPVPIPDFVRTALG